MKKFSVARNCGLARVALQTLTVFDTFLNSGCHVIDMLVKELATRPVHRFVPPLDVLLYARPVSRD